MTNPIHLALLPGLDGTGRLFHDLLPHLGRELTEYARARLPAGPLVPLGESFAGPLAIALASSQAEVRGLILSGTFAPTPWPLPGASARLARLGALQNAGLKLALGRFAKADMLQAMRSALSGVPTKVIERRLREILAVDVTSELSRLKAPILSLLASHPPAGAPLGLAQCEGSPTPPAAAR